MILSFRKNVKLKIHTNSVDSYDVFIKRAALVEQTEAHVVIRLLRLFFLLLFLLFLLGCNENRKGVQNQRISVNESNVCGSFWTRAWAHLVRLHLQERQQRRRPERLHHRLQRYRSDCRCQRWPEPEHRKWHQTSPQHTSSSDSRCTTTWLFNWTGK